jgi:CheY-like chemotaxis protein/sRNA-binding carbon storage regulator CsrA
MLFISRKPKQSIDFPDLGITVEILDTNTSRVRVGVEAPVEVRVARNELLDEKTKKAIEQRVFRVPPGLRHELRNELNLISLSLYVFKRKLEKGMASPADLPFDDLAQRIANISSHESLSAPKVVIEEESVEDSEPCVSALIVDDSENERELLGGFLEMHGFRINSVPTAEDALVYLENSASPPDAILLDMQLPKIQGAELLKMIRHSEKYDNTLVIIVSGTTAEENNLSEKDGLDAWFEKPIDPRKLVCALQQIEGAEVA